MYICMYSSVSTAASNLPVTSSSVLRTSRPHGVSSQRKFSCFISFQGYLKITKVSDVEIV
jgi:hypothetical protein